MTKRWVEISFDCLPLRSVTRLDIPLDASPAYRQRCERIQEAMQKHGTHNSYYVYNARCKYHLINRDGEGEIEFRFEGTVLTDQQDMHCRQCDLHVELVGETCEWLTEPVAQWFAESVPRAMAAEFDYYIAAGDLEKTRDRLQKLDADTDDLGGFVGMHL